MSRSVISHGTPAIGLVALMVVVLSWLPARADEGDDRYAVAAGHYAQARWKLAAEEFRTFLEEHPLHPQADQAVFFLAEALVQLGKIDEAAPRFRDYLHRAPHGSLARSATFRAGETEYLAGNYQLAKVQLQRFSTSYSDDELNAYVLPYLGDVALSEKDYSQAEKHFRAGLTRFPLGKLQDECRFGLARALEKLEQVEEAERFYLAVAAKTGIPLADDAQFYLGALQYSSGRFEEALEAFDAFESNLAESPWQPTARLGAGWALLKLERLAEAESFFQKITSDAKVGVDALYWLGLTLKARKDWSAATGLFLKTAKAHPDHKLVSALRFHAGDCLLYSGDPRAAVAQFDLVIASTASQNEWADDAMRGRIQAALQTRDHEKLDREVAEFDSRFPESPLKPDVVRMLARSLIERKQFHKAVEVLEPAVAVDEQVLRERYLLSLAYEGLDRYEDALAALSPVVDSASGQLLADARLARASLLMKLKRFADAVSPLEAFLADNSEGNRAVKGRGNLAICYAKTDRLGEAKKLHAELTEEYPNHQLIEPITQQLAEAAYDAGDVLWSGKLFAWLANNSRSSDENLKGLSGLGWSQYKAGQLGLAEATFQELLSADPDPPLAAEAALIRGQILQQLGQADPALAMYDLIIDRYSESEQFPQALWSAALIRDELAQDREAAELYEQLAETNPRFPEIDALLYNWAWTLDDLGRCDDSVALFDRIRQEHPDSSYWADTTFRLAQRAFDAEDYLQARQLVAEVLTAESNTSIRQNALYLGGQIAAAEGNWDEARQSFQTLIDDYPESSLRLLAEYGIAEASFRQNEYDQAHQRFERLDRQTQGREEPWLAVIRLRLAQSLCHKKKWEDAYAVASTIQSKYPNFEEQYEVDYVIGRCLSNRAEFEQARDAYRRVIRSPRGAKTETAAESHLMMAESYYHQKNYQAALREYLALEILYDYPTWQAAAVFQAGKCHEMLGEWKQAVQQYTRLLDTYPDASFTREASQRLEAARNQLP